MQQGFEVPADRLDRCGRTPDGSSGGDTGRDVVAADRDGDQTDTPAVAPQERLCGGCLALGRVRRRPRAEQWAAGRMENRSRRGAAAAEIRQPVPVASGVGGPTTWYAKPFVSVCPECGPVGWYPAADQSPTETYHAPRLGDASQQSSPRMTKGLVATRRAARCDATREQGEAENCAKASLPATGHATAGVCSARPSGNGSSVRRIVVMIPPWLCRGIRIAAPLSEVRRLLGVAFQSPVPEASGLSR